MQAMFGNHVCICVCIFFFFSRVCETCGYCSCIVHEQQPQSSTFLTFFQPISAHRALFMDPQISLFSNFFIKNGFHGTIHTFKNYFATVFFSFQFSAVSKRTPNMKNISTNQTSTLIKSAFISNQSLICAMHQKMTKNEI